MTAADSRRQLLTTRDIAQVLSVSERTVQRLAAAGELTVFRVGGAVRFDQAELERFVESCRQRPVAAAAAGGAAGGRRQLGRLVRREGAPLMAHRVQGVDEAGVTAGRNVPPARRLVRPGQPMPAPLAGGRRCRRCTSAR